MREYPLPSLEQIYSSQNPGTRIGVDGGRGVLIVYILGGGVLPKIWTHNLTCILDQKKYISIPYFRPNCRNCTTTKLKANKITNCEFAIFTHKNDDPQQKPLRKLWKILIGPQIFCKDWLLLSKFLKQNDSPFSDQIGLTKLVYDSHLRGVIHHLPTPLPRFDNYFYLI